MGKSILSHFLFRSVGSAKRGASRRLGPVMAIEVDGPALRVADIDARSVVTRVEAVPLEFAADAERSDPVVLGQAVKAALDRLRIRPGQIVMGVPRASVLLRTVSLPALENLDDAAAMIHLQVGKELPFPASEALIDFQLRTVPAKAEAPSPPPKPAGTHGEPEPPPVSAIPRMEALVAVVKRDVVESFKKTCESAGLKLAGLGLLSEANARCVKACRVTEAEQGVAVVTLRPDEVGIDVVVRGTLLFSRGASVKPQPEPPQPPAEPPAAPASDASSTAPPGAQPAPEAPPPKVFSLVEAAGIEVVRSLHGYGGMEALVPLARVVVAGATGQEPALVEMLQARLNLPCSVLDVAKALELPPACREQAAGSIPAIGLALGANDEEGLPFNFLAPRQPVVPRDLRRIMLLLGSVAGLAVFLFAFGIRSYLAKQRQLLRAKVAAELAEAKKKRPVYRQMKQQLATIDEWSQGAHNWLEHFAFLTAVLPPADEVYVSSLSIGASGSIRLSVQARSGQVLAKLDKQLRGAGYEVKPLAIAPGEDKYGYEFRSTVEIEVPAKMKIDLAKAKAPPRPPDDASLEAPRKGATP